MLRICCRHYLLACFPLIFNATATAQDMQPEARWSARWIAAADAPPQAAGVFHFRKSFELAGKPERFLVNVSADNRYRLFANGVLVSSGPARGDLMHWRYETVDLAPYLRSGRNVLAALVWNWGEYRPAAQISYRTGFLLRGEDNGQRMADTNASWKVFWNQAYSFTRVIRPDDGGYYAASPGENLDASLYPWGWELPAFDDNGWPAAGPLADPARLRGTDPFGVAGNWQLVPRNIPPMEERPGLLRTRASCCGDYAGRRLHQWWKIARHPSASTSIAVARPGPPEHRLSRPQHQRRGRRIRRDHLCRSTV